jgi:hypothetical protein
VTGKNGVTRNCIACGELDPGQRWLIDDAIKAEKRRALELRRQAESGGIDTWLFCAGCNHRITFHRNSPGPCAATGCECSAWVDEAEPDDAVARLRGTQAVGGEVRE